MTEKIYMSASPHKRLDVQLGLAAYGQKVRFANPPEFSREADIPSPVGAPLKTWLFLQNEPVARQIALFDDLIRFWAFTMDVSGFIPGLELSESQMLMTCRGLVSSLEKTNTTAASIYDKRKQGRGTIFFDNTCGPVKIENGKPVDWRGFVARSELSMSINLIRMMADERIWRKILEASERESDARPLANAGSIGGTDWSILSEKLRVISTTSGVTGLDVVWKNQYGRKWISNENGVQKGMTQDMTRHLRGFPMATIRGLANLPN